MHAANHYGNIKNTAGTVCVRCESKNQWW